MDYYYYYSASVDEIHKFDHLNEILISFKWSNLWISKLKSFEAILSSGTVY